MTAPTCATCRFWRSYVTNGKEGSCRVHSPWLFLSPSGYRVTDWPETGNDDWCGEHVPKADA